MISIEMSPCQFAKVNELITKEHPEATLETGDDIPVLNSNLATKTGHIHTSQIDADYEYRQRDDNYGTLVFLNEVKHGMYHLVSDDTIGAHLGKLLLGIVCDETFTKSSGIDGDAGDWTQTQGAGLTDNTKPTILPSSNEVKSFVKAPIQREGASN